MPYVVGHSLGGICISEIFHRNMFSDFSFKRISVIILLSNLSDIDYIPYLIFGTKGAYLIHHGVTHTLIFAVFVSLICLFIFKSIFPFNLLKKFFLFFALIYSNTILDFFSYDDIPPYGMMLFYPLSNKYFIASHKFFHPFAGNLNAITKKALLMFPSPLLWTLLYEFVVFLVVYLLIISLKYVMNRYSITKHDRGQYDAK